MLQIVRALPADSAALKEIAILSKGFWGYPQDLMAQWAHSPIITPQSIAAAAVYKAVLETAAVGWYRLWDNSKTATLDDLWILPAFMRQGIGRSLFQHAVTQARAFGALSIELDADPNAVPFYERLGCYKFGEKLSEWQRLIPRMRYDLPPSDDLA
ncbi:MAG: GNAT family N-acetyltransferase [Anaerolineaceae bacterium]|nr:GNAT family N-acetyltransferase [Anaerolineaceae bacterium]